MESIKAAAIGIGDKWHAHVIVTNKRGRTTRQRCGRGPYQNIAEAIRAAEKYIERQCA